MNNEIKSASTQVMMAIVVSQELHQSYGILLPMNIRMEQKADVFKHLLKAYLFDEFEILYGNLMKHK